MNPTKTQLRSPKSRLLGIGIIALLAVVSIVAIAASRPETSSKASSSTPVSASRGVTGGDFHSLVADPTTPGRLFVGGHEAVSMSEDGGKSWTRLRELDDADAMGWAFTDDAVYVTGHPGISRSSDGAARFETTNDGLPDTDVHAFAASGDTQYAAGPALGVSASTDGGKSWASRTDKAGQSFFGRILIGADDEQQLIAADARNGGAASDDGGRTWRRLGGPPSALWVSRSGNMLFVSGRQAAKTSDGGATWTDLKLPPGASLVESDPNDPQLLYAGVHRGDAVEVWVSQDGGNRWTRP